MVMIPEPLAVALMIVLPLGWLVAALVWLRRPRGPVAPVASRVVVVDDPRPDTRRIAPPAPPRSPLVDVETLAAEVHRRAAQERHPSPRPSVTSTRTSGPRHAARVASIPVDYTTPVVSTWNTGGHSAPACSPAPSSGDSGVSYSGGGGGFDGGGSCG